MNSLDLVARIAKSLGHPGETVSQASIESLVDEWVRAMSWIGRLVGGRNPLEIAEAVENVMQGKLPLKTKVDVFEAAPEVSTKAFVTAANEAPRFDRWTVEAGKLYVYIGGVRLRVTGVELA
jgi:hypothetical protein